MNLQFGERFKSARLLSGLSLQDVADRVSKSLTRQAIYRYEKGQVVPDSELLAELSSLFNVRPDFFFRETQVEIGTVEYRRLRMPSKEESKIAEQTKDYLSRYLELENILGIAEEFHHPLKNFKTVSTYSDVNKAADELRKKWSLGTHALPNIAELLEDKGIKVVKLNAPGEFDGLQTFANGSIPVVAYNERKSMCKERIRFTLLHELAHLLLRFDSELNSNEKERLCHQFAGAMLLPKARIIEELGANRKRLSLQELENVKRQYGISIQAIVMRAHTCDIINNNYKRQLFDLLEVSKLAKSEAKIEESRRFDQLIHRALVEELISMSKAAALKNMTVSEFKSHAQMM